MAQISQGRTVFIIAHRLSTVRPAHRIYVVEKGEIVEQGSHEELLRMKGFYARLCQHQDGYTNVKRETREALRNETDEIDQTD
jgi:ATP-binding cassette, subfamily B, bacterial HlyB/CyaB